MTVTVAPSCTACGLCLATCPTHALVPAPHRPDVVDARCTDCWLCLEVCPVDAVIAVGEATSPAAGSASAGAGPRPLAVPAATASGGPS